MQANNGAVACQLLDRLNPLNPEVVNLRKVDYNAASAYYMEQNWRILQRAFVELEIDWVGYCYSNLGGFQTCWRMAQPYDVDLSAWRSSVTIAGVCRMWTSCAASKATRWSCCCCSACSSSATIPGR